jgi:hypothetical protein
MGQPPRPAASPHPCPRQKTRWPSRQLPFLHQNKPLRYKRATSDRIYHRDALSRVVPCAKTRAATAPLAGLAHGRWQQHTDTCAPIKTPLSFSQFQTASVLCCLSSPGSDHSQQAASSDTPGSRCAPLALTATFPPLRAFWVCLLHLEAPLHCAANGGSVCGRIALLSVSLLCTFPHPT